MNDVELMGGGDRVARLEHVVHGLHEIELTARDDLLLEIGSLEVLHDHVRHAGRQHPDVGHAAHVIGLDARRRTRLAEEARDRLVPRAEAVLDQELDRDDLVEGRVPRRHDEPHRADADHALDAVLVDDVTDVHRQRQVGQNLERHETKSIAERTSEGRWARSIAAEIMSVLVLPRLPRLPRRAAPHEDAFESAFVSSGQSPTLVSADVVHRPHRSRWWIDGSGCPCSRRTARDSRLPDACSFHERKHGALELLAICRARGERRA